MAKIKIDQFNDYYNAELTGVFHEDVAILGGGDTEEEHPECWKTKDTFALTTFQFS